MKTATAVSVAPRPQPPAKLDVGRLEALARERLGEAVYEDVFAFILTFSYSRELNRHLRDLDGIRKDLDWLRRHAPALSTYGPSVGWPTVAVPAALKVWLEEEQQRHNAAILVLQRNIKHARDLHPKAAAEAERVVRLTYDEWLEMAPGR